jgi:hypothetical protein
MHLIALTQSCTGPVFLECGQQERTRLCACITEAGGTLLGIWPITYYHTHPAILCGFAWTPDVVTPTLPDGMDDDDTPTWVLQTYRPAAVLDWCMGRGLTAVSADALDIAAYGLELHPRRLAVTIAKLVERGHTARQIGRLA